MPMLSPSFSTKLGAEVDRVKTLFSDAGAQWVEAPTLLPAKTMLDLYGESLRDHAYIIHDPMDGDFVLRPDFTVPLVEAHMSVGSEPARYAYSGRVWRKREGGERRHSFWQMGFELFDRGDRAQNDVEIFALATKIAAPHQLNVTIGDFGLIFTALDVLDIAPWRKVSLKRHVWRPRAFARLINQYTEPNTVLKVNEALNLSIPEIGLRTREMIEARMALRALEQETPPISVAVKQFLLNIFDIRGTLKSAESNLQAIARNDIALRVLVDQFSARNQALSQAGIDPASLNFDAGFGRETMEYYDGFVFGFKNTSGKTVISGGRYDNLTEILGQGRKIPAIGVACFPELFEANR